MKKDTSWDNVASWYDTLLEDKEATYQGRVILPNLLRLLDVKKGDTVLDIACGPGFFAHEIEKKGARVIGVDLSPKLISRAKTMYGDSIEFRIAPAHEVLFVKDKSVDSVIIVLAIQNIEDIHAVFKECARVLKPKGRLYLVLNHPAFRVPKESSWGFDNETKVQYRRVNRYLSEQKSKIQMHPGDKSHEYTISFHRPLQSYVKSLGKQRLYIRRLEEWVSDKISEPGPYADAENRARGEFPLFMCIEAINVI